MKRRFAAALVAVCVPLGLTTAAEGATKTSDIGGVRFDQQNGNTVVVGSVDSPASACRARRKVILFARTLEGETVRLGTDKTSDNGGFFFRATLPEDLDETFVFTPPKKVSKRLRCATANGPINPIDINPND